MSEQTLHAKDFESFEIVEFLRETNLLDTMLKLPPFVSLIVLEFYVNLTKKIVCSNCKDTQLNSPPVSSINIRLALTFQTYGRGT